MSFISCNTFSSLKVSNCYFFSIILHNLPSWKLTFFLSEKHSLRQHICVANLGDSLLVYFIHFITSLFLFFKDFPMAASRPLSPCSTRATHRKNPGRWPPSLLSTKWCLLKHHPYHLTKEATWALTPLQELRASQLPLGSLLNKLLILLQVTSNMSFKKSNHEWTEFCYI